MPSMSTTAIPPLGRIIGFLVLFGAAFQLVVFLRQNEADSNTNFFGGFTSDDAYHPEEDQFTNEHEHVDFRPDATRNRHATVPLSLTDLATLDKLAEAIAEIEAHRVFEDGNRGRIHGIASNDKVKAKQIRDQIDCWTNNGTWQRREGQFEYLKHKGDSRFSKCDATFARALGRDGGGHTIGEFDHVHDRFMIREAVKYQWVPDEAKCGRLSSTGVAGDVSTYTQFTKKEFCAAVDKRDILIVGDVTQYQLHDILLSAFDSQFTCYGEMGCLDHGAHGLCQGVAMKFARNDLISVPWAVDPEDDEYPSASAIEQPWATPDMLTKYKIVLLNRGLVWRPDEIFLQELVFTMKELWKNYPGTMILYRATHPLAACNQLKEEHEDEAIADKNGNPTVPGITIQKPLTKPPKRMSEKTYEKIYRPTIPDIQRQNKIAKWIVEAAGGIFLDTENMFAVRPDGRMGDGDCSRFCAPGPIDAYVDLLHNTLRLLHEA